MIPKPKELTGDVKPLSVLISLAIANPYTNTDAERLNDIDRFNEFYSQPFTPELLELFEGWGEWNKNTAVYGYDWDYYITKVYENYILNKRYNSWQIKTLSDFITLCTLAGVELKWKE